MIASSGLRGDAARVKEIGFAAYLPKPVTAATLLDCLLELRERAGRRRRRWRRFRPDHGPQHVRAAPGEPADPARRRQSGELPARGADAREGRSSDRCGRRRCARGRGARRQRLRSGPDGRADAGRRRVRGDPPDSRAAERPRRGAGDRDHRQCDGRRRAALPRARAWTTMSPSRSTARACWPRWRNGGRAPRVPDDSPVGSAARPQESCLFGRPTVDYATHGWPCRRSATTEPSHHGVASEIERRSVRRDPRPGRRLAGRAGAGRDPAVRRLVGAAAPGRPQGGHRRRDSGHARSTAWRRSRA